MSDYDITVNSTVGVPLEWLNERGVSMVPLRYTIEGETYTDKSGQDPRDFYALLREGKQAITSQASVEDAICVFEPRLKEGRDILHITFSSAMSGTYNSMCMARDQLLEQYPERKIIVADSLSACAGEGILLYYALKLRDDGKTIDEVFDWIMENRLHVCVNFTVHDLNHLHRGGRISKTSAVVGTIVQMKPMIHINDTGELKVIGKERGRKKSLNKLVDTLSRQSEGWDNEIVMISHGDVIEDAEYVAGLLREKMGVEHILIGYTGTVIGSHTGPGVIVVACLGGER